MPDHVHLLLTPLSDVNGVPAALATITSGIKGAAAHSVNRHLGRRGHVWQDESYDHIVRDDEGMYATAEYICENPVRKGLARVSSDYPWIWREWDAT